MPEFKWQSDVIAHLIKTFGFSCIALNPGASYRGLHDSLVNYNGDDPPMLLCQHEKIAVQIAHGYAKASGRPMVAIVHDVVGLLHSLLGVYYAYVDRAPVFLIGATGPMDESKRRPFIDWTHTANVQGEQLRNFVKWDYQPGSIEGVPDSFARAYSIMMAEPQGPVYMCYDALLQETPFSGELDLPKRDLRRVPTRIAPEPEALTEAAHRMVDARWPVLMAEFTGRAESGFDDLVELANVLGAPVVDLGIRLNFPNRHPMNMTFAPKETFGPADLICGLDLRDWEKATHFNDRINRKKRAYYADDCKWLRIGFEDTEISKWSMDYGPFPDCDQRVLADTAIAIPALTRLCRDLIGRDRSLSAKVERRRRVVADLHAQKIAGWEKSAREDWDASPLTLARLALEVWDKVQHEDWVLSAGTLDDWALKLWNVEQRYRHPGKSLGTATQIGISLGVALAHRDRGRLVVDFQPDGDLMFDVGALWFAAHNRLPMLAIMHNNRAYYNDWEHQITVARQRGTPVERANIGMEFADPAPDFATLARSFGWYAEGPIATPHEVGPALERAIAQVKAGRPALLDTLTQCS